MLCLFPNPSPRFSSSVPLSSPTGSRRAGVLGAVYSSHSNPRILKSNRGSHSGRRGVAYEDEDGESGAEDYPPFSDEFSNLEEFDYYQNYEKYSKFSSSGPNKISGSERWLKKGQGDRFANASSGVKNIKEDDIILKKFNIKGHRYTASASAKTRQVDLATRGNVQHGKFRENRYQKLAEELDFDEKWFPLIDYLSTFGLKESHFISIYERHMPCLQINLVSAQERLEFLIGVGVKHRDIKRVILRQPQILEYTVENNMKSHVAFLLDVGIPQSRIGHIITSAPSLFSYSVEHSLKPTIRYLVEEVGIKRSDVGKVIQLSPQVLVQRIDNSWTSRFCFLSRELEAPRDSIVKMVTKHPQLLHYSIEDGISPRIDFLRSIGMRNADILKVLTSLTQVLSLSLEENLKPKYLYLVNELNNEVKSLTKYPMYLSLSLEQRIRPRHRFLVSLKKAPKGPFPLSSLVPTDESFCQQWAGTTVDEYLAFRQSLQLTDLAKKYARKR